MSEQGYKNLMYVVGVLALTLAGVSFLSPLGDSGNITGRAGGYGSVIAEGGRASMLRQCRCVYTTGELRARGRPCGDSVANAVEVHRVWMVGDGGTEAWVIQSSRAEMCTWLSEVEYNFAEEPWIQDNGEGHLTEWLEKAGTAITPQ